MENDQEAEQMEEQLSDQIKDPVHSGEKNTVLRSTIYRNHPEA